MIIEQVLRSVLPHLDRLGIPYLITGGIAATLHGRPRFTQDIDFVIAPSQNQLESLVDALDGDFVVSRDAAREAHDRLGEFNAIHRTLIFKVDFWFSTGDAFDASRLARATKLEVTPGLAVRVATAEDAIISKLLWMRQGATGRSTEDIQGILRANAGVLNLDYLDYMARTLGLDQLWTTLRPRR
jgi:hypothetical protein